MTIQDFALTISVEQTPEEVFDAITHVRGWWSGEIDGSAENLGDEFNYRYKDVHQSKQRVTELVRGKRIVWHVIEATLTFVADASEWKGTDIVFEIGERAGKTEVRFTHVGLSAKCECYQACSSGWRALLTGNLRRWIASGTRQPDAFAAG